MAPNKPKLYKNTGRPTIRSTEQNHSVPSTSTVSPEIEQKFEVELCWCIQQLQTALKLSKLNNKQVQDHSKSLKTLMSNTAPMVKKRQVMRLCFGDYREKMAAVEKKTSKNVLNMKIKTAVPSNKSVFVKKGAFTTPVGNSFRFNFEDSGKSDPNERASTFKTEECQGNSDKKRTLNFAPSDNSFRFGFKLQEDI